MVQFSKNQSIKIFGPKLFRPKAYPAKTFSNRAYPAQHLQSFASLSLTFHKEDNGENDLSTIKGSPLHLTYEKCTICRRHSLQPQSRKVLTKGRPLSKAAMAKQHYPCIAQIWSFLPTLTQYSKLSFGSFLTLSWYLRVGASQSRYESYEVLHSLSESFLIFSLKIVTQIMHIRLRANKFCAVSSRVKANVLTKFGADCTARIRFPPVGVFSALCHWLFIPLEFVKSQNHPSLHVV